jgi:hypothetical protein
MKEAFALSSFLFAYPDLAGDRPLAANPSNLEFRVRLQSKAFGHG